MELVCNYNVGEFYKIAHGQELKYRWLPAKYSVGKDILMVFNMVLFILSRYIMVVYTIYLQQCAFWAIKDPLAAFFLC